MQIYISCDSAAQSEIVVPIGKRRSFNRCLDIDCGVTKGYDEIDQAFLEKYVDLLSTNFNINAFSFINN